MNAPFATRHAISRVRRDTRLRRLEVCTVERLPPNMQPIARQLRRYMLEERGHPAAWLQPSGDWVVGRGRGG